MLGSLQSPRLDNLVATFQARYGVAPSFVARAPGRVNLIGEHIDYSGYGVLPMAIQQDVMIAVSVNDSDTFHLQNVSESHTPRQYKASPVVIDNTKHDWGNYVLCGYKAIVDDLKGAQAKGVSMLVDGNIPSGAGLSSSSALVCCAALATAHANGVSHSKVAFAALTAKCEQYVGTEGGGMDQSISFLGEVGTAKFIEFNPIRATSVSLPAGAAFVIANSLVEANKYVSAGSCYNKRVVECRLAARLLCHAAGIDKEGTLRRLGEVQAALGKTLPEMEALVDSTLHAAAYTKDELASILAIGIPELEQKWMSPSTITQESFLLHQRAKHVFSEAHRVLEFQKAATLEELGALMNASHASCKDLFECSCPELDQLTELCKASGALGSRLTGAGWGGCTVSLVPQEHVEAFVAAVRKGYYEPNGDRLAKIATSLFVTQPGQGAAIINLA